MRFVLDEMFPRDTSRHLSERGQHDATHVTDIGFGGASDDEVARHARSIGATLVTENVVDFAREADLVVVFVRKRDLPSGGAQAAALADVVHRWAQANPQPYVGHHWPR